MHPKRGKTKFSVCIEGNIGSGKTTMLRYFRNGLDVDIVEEPVEKWRNFRGHNLLDFLYKDTQRWSYLFQSYVQLTMMQMHLKECHASVKLMERSLHSARYCFVENLYQEGRMSDPEYKVYCEWYNLITENVDVGIDLIVYLRTDPKEVHKRIIKRARSEEQQIPLEYLGNLHNQHEDWLLRKKYPLPAPVLVIDANEEVPAMYKKFEEYAGHILCKKYPFEESLNGSQLIFPDSLV